jgi:hypothetical protein
MGSGPNLLCCPKQLGGLIVVSDVRWQALRDPMAAVMVLEVGHSAWDALEGRQNHEQLYMADLNGIPEICARGGVIWNNSNIGIICS